MDRLPRLALVLAFALLAAAPAHAAPQWLLPANTLTGPDDIGTYCPVPSCPPNPPSYRLSGESKHVAMDGAGNTTVLRSRRNPSTDRYELLALTRPAGGQFGAAEVLSTDHDTSWGTALTVDKQGNAVAAWTTGPQPFVQVSVRPAGGAFGPAQQVAAPYSVFPAVALDGQGTVVALWARFDGTDTKVEYTVRAPGQTLFSPPVAISDNAVTDGSIRVAMNEAGHAVAVWSMAAGGSSPNRVQASIKAPGNPFSSAQTISGTNAYNPSVAIDPGGNAVAVWSRFNGSNTMVEYGVRPAAGFFPVTGTVMSASGAGPPQVVMDPQGNAVAAWYRINGGPWRVESSVRPAGGSFPPLGTDMSGDRQSFEGPVLAASSRGDVVLAWNRHNDANDEFVEALVRPAGGSFGESKTLDTHPFAGNSGLGRPLVAMDGPGNGVAVWDWYNIDTLKDGSRFAGYDGAGPQLRALQIPSQATVGTPAAFSVSAVDVWSPVSTAWDFGDGSAALTESASHTYAAAGDRSVGVTATDSLGNATSATQALSVTASGGGADIQAPALSAVGLLRSTFAVAPGATALSAAKKKKKAKRGSAFRYTLSEAATVRIAIERALPGRRSGRKCAKPSPKLKKKKACTRYAKAGTLTRKRPSGKTTTPFSGRIGKRALKPGRYRATLTATDAAGNRSKAKRLNFKIVR